MTKQKKVIKIKDYERAKGFADDAEQFISYVIQPKSKALFRKYLSELGRLKGKRFTTKVVTDDKTKIEVVRIK